MLTTDKKDPKLNQVGEGGQMKSYLILSDEERQSGFVRPLQTSYVHKTCGAGTQIRQEIAETFAKDPKFYEYTFCCECGDHFPVSEFTWEKTDNIVGE
jgi:hypothetical protein